MLNALRTLTARRLPHLLSATRVLRGYPYVPVPDGRVPAWLDYPVTCRARWGHGRPAHPELARIIGSSRETYADVLRSFLPYAGLLATVPAEGSEAHWNNPMLPTLDGIAIYSFLAARSRNLYVEVGSGNSTLFARKALKEHGHSTRIISIDPCPRAEIDALCDGMIRSPLEETDLQVFSDLSDGDVLFIDNSHRSFMNSDVTVFFLEILPRLRPGVLVGIHDICLPDDYPEHWSGTWFNEQYMLAAWLLGGGRGVNIHLPAWYASHDAELAAVVSPLYAQAGIPGPPHGCAFWFHT
jgi:hypothetical protein